jgi:hypothetical protein
MILDEALNSKEQTILNIARGTVPGKAQVVFFE